MRRPFSPRSLAGVIRFASAGWRSRNRAIVFPSTAFARRVRAASTSGSSGMKENYRDAARDDTPAALPASWLEVHPSAVSTHREPAVRNTLILILVLNALVAAVKIVVGLRTNALSVLGASLESALDVLNNVVGIALVRVASQEPDEDHPYGHQKFETLGALGIVGFLSISCFELLREGVSSILNKSQPREIHA